ncbi:MAG: pitrilysin family protein [Myxococcota bacterium]|nr:pitrilysin family protein [Myxococcota bacterium]
MTAARRALFAGTLALAWLVAGCASVGVPAWDLPPPAAPDRPVVEPGALQRAELDNDMDVLVLEDRRLPRIVLGVAVRRGGDRVAPDQAGLAAFTTEVMKRGAGERDALALSQATDEIGASLSVSGDWDSTVVTVAGLSRDREQLLSILADVVLRPRFEAGEANKARDETLASLERAKDDPATLARWNFARALYPGHPYGVPRSGTPETVARLDASQARAFHRAIFVPNDAIFFAAGDVDMKSLLPAVGKAFGAWERGEVVPPGPPPPERVPAARRIVIVDRPDLAQARVTVGHEGLSRTDPKRIPASLMNTVLGGGGFSSRLMETLRTEGGLTYGVGSGFSLRRHPGPFYVSTFTRVPEVRRVLDLILADLEKMREEPPTPEELRDAKALRVGLFGLGLETSTAVLSAEVDLDIYGLPEDSLDTYRGRVRAVDPEDTAQMARELLHPDRLVIVLVGPADALSAQVEGLGPVEVIQP